MIIFCSNSYYKKQRNSELIHTGILKIIPRPYSGIAEGSVFVAVAVVKQAGFYFFGEEITAGNRIGKVAGTCF